MLQMIEPMLAQLTDKDIHLTGVWLSEPKYDGERMIAMCSQGNISLWTKRHVQATKKFPELVGALKKSLEGQDWMLDGEVTVSGGFRKLLKRNVEDKTKIYILSKKIPAIYNIFDILLWENEDLTKKSLIERKKILIGAIKPNEHIKIVPFKEVNSQNVEKHFNQYINEGFEGTVLKNSSSYYEPGRRSGQWLKIKMGDTVDVNVVGATKSTGSIAFGALILEKNGKFFGKVGTGFSDQDRKNILALLEKHKAPLSIQLPQNLESEVLITNKPLLAEIKVQEMIKRSPRAPVWVRFRWED
jgi:DNA ligase-1